MTGSYRPQPARGRHRARTLRRRRPAHLVTAVIGAALIAGIGAAATTGPPPATAITVAAAPAAPTLPLTNAERIYLAELAEAGVPFAGPDADTAVVIAREHVAHGHLVGMREAIRADFRTRLPALTPDQVEDAKTAVEHHFLAVTGRKQ
ncbi:hypothetical protein I4I73_03370 [Pseudonocardia sp. KRD-184]|uniref:DUF732 domain-containing protein n=1 Tax=Pseudonocardia oceani TaxID=2792013 RepID=A0ABS6UH84_9PSEU|nr:hypothetical protein [Pseudonocardia oceani]MBW0088255.1 hypothetical protein [Pseudonocardia oceani]MBW0095037.1 hypothetical protein [Pseudonocardia oceani]MBW0121110.1 hypothetical protein [Pseudonocardia oceani]MBW0131204.1 hypothetical protein [Pseudonocardia oceani]MBW0132629.1 hypothetical protein [Pseudonocardia oceani]